MMGAEAVMWLWALIACGGDCEAGFHDEGGTCVADAVEDTEPVAPCEASAWCMSGTFVLTNIADTVNGEPNTRVFDGLEGLEVAFEVGFDVDVDLTVDDPKAERRISAFEVQVGFDPDPKGVLAERAAPSMAAGALELSLVGDQPGGDALVVGPTLTGAFVGEEAFELRITGGNVDQEFTDYPAFEAFSLAGTRVELARVVGEDATDLGSGTADVTVAPR